MTVDSCFLLIWTNCITLFPLNFFRNYQEIRDSEKKQELWVTLYFACVGSETQTVLLFCLFSPLNFSSKWISWHTTYKHTHQKQSVCHAVQAWTSRSNLSDPALTVSPHKRHILSSFVLSPLPRGRWSTHSWIMTLITTATTVTMVTTLSRMTT